MIDLAAALSEAASAPCTCDLTATCPACQARAAVLRTAYEAGEEVILPNCQITEATPGDGEPIA